MALDGVKYAERLRIITGAIHTAGSRRELCPVEWTFATDSKLHMDLMGQTKEIVIWTHNETFCVTLWLCRILLVGYSRTLGWYKYF